MKTPSILIAGVGNIFMGDDAFGVEVAHRLLRRRLPDGVRVVDFGIRGLDLAYALAEDYSLIILVDAVSRGEKPGTLYTIEPELRNAGGSGPHQFDFDPHGMDPIRVLRMARMLGGETARLLLVGCEPEILGSEEDVSMGLTPAVETAVSEAIILIESLLAREIDSITVSSKETSPCV